MATNVVVAPRRPRGSELLDRIARTLARPEEWLARLPLRFGNGSRTLYSELVDRLPVAGRLVQSLLPVRVELDRPVFVAGLRCSGATLLYRMLQAHPDLFLYDERFPRCRGAHRGSSQPDRRRSRIWSQQTPEDFRSTLFCYIRPNVRLGYRRWGAKLALEVGDPTSGSPNAHDLRQLLRCMPGAGVIGVVRDPRDFVLASLRSAGQDADWWIDDYGIMTRLFCELRLHYPQRFLVVRHEDLVTRPEEVVRRCCSFVGLGYDPGMLRPESWPADDPRELAPGAVVGRIHEWRAAEGTDRLIVEQVERSCFPAASALGYTPEASRVPAAVIEAYEVLARLGDEAAAP